MKRRTRRTAGLILAGVLAVERRSVRQRRRGERRRGGQRRRASRIDGRTVHRRGGGGGAEGEGITLAVNPWTGSAVNANVAKVVLESKLNTPSRAARHRRERDVARPRRRRHRRRARGLAVRSRRRRRDVHRREEDASSTSACSGRRPRSVGTCRPRRRRAPRARHVGGLQGSRDSPSCSPPPSRATTVSS